MKLVETFTSENEYGESGPWELSLIRDSGQKIEISAHEGEPEDNRFGRDLNFVFSISDLIRAAYDAGKKGEEFHYEYIEEKDEDDQ